jgi:hypothetical protein
MRRGSGRVRGHLVPALNVSLTNLVTMATGGGIPVLTKDAGTRARARLAAATIADAEGRGRARALPMSELNTSGALLLDEKVEGLGRALPLDAGRVGIAMDASRRNPKRPWTKSRKPSLAPGTRDASWGKVDLS